MGVAVGRGSAGGTVVIAGSGRVGDGGGVGVGPEPQPAAAARPSASSTSATALVKFFMPLLSHEKVNLAIF